MRFVLFLLLALPVAAHSYRTADEPVINLGPRIVFVASADPIEIAVSHEAHIRAGKLAVAGLTADAVVPRGSDDATLKQAIDLARAGTPFTKRPPAMTSAFPVPRIVEKPYSDMHYPDLEHRLLARRCVGRRSRRR